MNENDAVVARQDKIRIPRQLTNVQAISKAKTMDHSANDHLRLCVLAANARHIQRALFAGHHIAHALPKVAFTCVMNSSTDKIRSRRPFGYTS